MSLALECDGALCGHLRAMVLSDQQRILLEKNKAAALAHRRERLSQREDHESDVPSGNRQRILTPSQLALIEQNRSFARLRASARFVIPSFPDGWHRGVAPPTPVDFGERFELPEHRTGLLAVLHGHHRDSRITFSPGPHVYRVDGVPTLGSVTGLVHAFAHPFEEQDVILKMQRGRNWPREGYVRTCVAQPIMDALQTVPLGRHLANVLMDQPRDESKVVLAAHRVLMQHPELKTQIDEICFSADEIKAMWLRNRTEGANRGTWMHLCYELWLNGEHVPFMTSEMMLFAKFITTLTGCSAYRTEWEIFGEDVWSENVGLRVLRANLPFVVPLSETSLVDPYVDYNLVVSCCEQSPSRTSQDERLAGSIDFVARESDGSFMVIDWKRSKDLRHKFVNTFQKMMHPLSHLDDCTGSHYLLQLNCYKYLLEKYYDLRIGRMLIVCTHPDNGDEPFVRKVPAMSQETEALMMWQRARASLQ